MNEAQTTDSGVSASAVFSALRSVLLALDLPGLTPERIQRSSLLMEELGVDSLRFIDLTVGIEDAFGFAEFPLQRWVDECVENDEPLSVDSLVAVCTRLVDAGASGKALPKAEAGTGAR